MSRDPSEIEAKMPRATYRPDAVARLLGISTASVRRLVKKGELEAAYVGNSMRVKTYSLAAYLARIDLPVNFEDLAEPPRAASAAKMKGGA